MRTVGAIAATVGAAMLVPTHAAAAPPVPGTSVVAAAADAPVFPEELAPPVRGAGSQQPDSAMSAGDSLRIFLMTMGPGEAVWERFGHNALWIHDPVAGTDRAYNYGLFSFAQEGFMQRFIQGRMEYWMGHDDAYLTIEAYRRADRSVWVQELNLTPEQKVALRDFLEWNERPENTFYRYDYYRDNCSTRIRDAIDLVLDGRLREMTSDLPTRETYRSHTRRLTGNDFPIHTGLLLAMGHPVDRELSVWEEMFLPMRFMEHVRSVTVVDEDGREAPLVSSEQALYLASSSGDDGGSGPSLLTYLLLGFVVGGVLAGVGSAARRHRSARIAFVTLGAGWLLAVGTLGVVISGLWLFTDHYVTYRNENVLQVHPLWLVTSGLILAGAFGLPRAAVIARRLAVGLAAIALAGVALQLVPGLNQENGPILALMVPATFGLAWGTAQWSMAASS